MKTLEIENLHCTEAKETKDPAKKIRVFRQKFAGTFTPGSINSPITCGKLDLTIPDYGMLRAAVNDEEGTVSFGYLTHAPEGAEAEIKAAREHSAWLLDSEPHDVTAEYQGVLVQKDLDLAE